MPNNQVYIHKSDADDYPASPFDPDQVFPEFDNWPAGRKNIDQQNKLYGHVRECLLGLGLDKENSNQPNWSPFKDLVAPGEKVVIKPNLVRGSHPLGELGVKSMVSQAALIRPIIDYLLLATDQKVEIVIADVPLQTTDWDKVIKDSRFKDLVDYYAKLGIKIPLLDLRKEISKLNETGVICQRDYQDRDPLGYSTVDLKDKSRLTKVINHSKKFQITDYGQGTVPPHHNQDKNEYFICKTILSADLFINFPKLKTHRKAGITAAMKNLIGINGDKRWIAHHRSGSPKSGGDEYLVFNAKNYFKWHLFDFLKRRKYGIPIATLIRKIYEKYVLKQTIEEASINTTPNPKNFLEGSWYGNDTVWRCIIDLNNIIFFADKNGQLSNTPQRKYLGLVDGILAGEGEGPMEQTPRKAGLLIAGTHPVAIDYAAAKVIGFDWQKIPQIRESFEKNGFDLTKFSPAEINMLSNKTDINSLNLKFKPSAGWHGHIELNNE